jgi:hypothetical protein
MIYMCCLVVCIPGLWFIPETKGKSLEEVGTIFGDRHVNVALSQAGSSAEKLPQDDKQANPQVGQAYEHVEGGTEH